MSVLDTDFINHFSSFEQRISDNELDSYRFIEIEFTRKIKVCRV
jgi:hypothetical protein